MAQPTDIVTASPKGASQIVTPKEVESKMMVLRNQLVILDRDVTTIYGVETKRINEAVKNNPDKFPEGYIFELNDEESSVLRSKISTLEPTYYWHVRSCSRDGAYDGGAAGSDRWR